MPALDLTVPTAHDTLDAQAALGTDLLQPVLAARDAEWQGELLSLLAEQEQRLREFTRRRFRTDPTAVVRAAVRMVQALDAAAACHAERATLIRANLPATRSGAAPFLRRADAVPPMAPARTLLGFTIVPARVDAVGRTAAAGVVAELPGTVEGYLLLLGNGFATGSAAARWVETCGVFIRQLTRLACHVTA